MYIDKNEYQVDSRVEHYEIEQFDSKNIEYAGYKDGNAFIQFRSGTTYFYLDLPKEVVQAGKFRSYKSEMDIAVRVVVPLFFCPKIF